jgi:anti-sigma factor RsiW
MNCQEALLLVPAYGDGELDPLQSAQIERHLGACAECAASLDAFFALRAKIRDGAPYYTAPPALRARVASLASTTSRRLPRPRGFLSGLALGCAATLLVWFVSTATMDRLESRTVERDVVASHVQATLGDRLLSVASSDRHTVKPWLTARLDYAPPVKDLAAEGFPLLGGRVDRLDDRAVAALVYGYRDHRIGVFVRPHDGGDLAPVLTTVRGFNVAHARQDRMDWWAVSDLNADALRGLVTSLSRSD